MTNNFSREIVWQNIQLKYNDVKVVLIRDSKHDHIELIMNETISHLDIDAHIS